MHNIFYRDLAVFIEYVLAFKKQILNIALNAAVYVQHNHNILYGICTDANMIILGVF